MQLNTKELCRCERHLAEFPHLCVVDIWLVTPMRALIAHRLLSCDRINMQLRGLRVIGHSWIFADRCVPAAAM